MQGGYRMNIGCEHRHPPPHSGTLRERIDILEGLGWRGLNQRLPTAAQHTGWWR